MAPFPLVDYKELLTTIRVFSMLEPVKALLFSNSVLLGEHEELLCCRDMFWENSTHGINPHNVGMFDRCPQSAEELLSYIESTSIYCVERGEKYINFPPINIMEYFEKPYVEGEYYENGAYKEIRVVPQIEDIRYLRTFKFEDLTFRGTIEFRSVCCQPIGDCMTVAAFHIGLKERLWKLVGDVLDLAGEGLAARGYGEECMLKPLYERLKTRSNPAKRMLEMRRQGIDLQDIIQQYGALT